MNYKELPDMVNYDEENEEILKKLHHALFNVRVWSCADHKTQS